MTSTPSLLFTLPLTSPLVPSLLSTHRPFARPSVLPQSAATKWVQRINAAIVSRDPAQLAVEEKRAALALAAEVVRQDGEGWTVAGWGKGWMTTSLGVVHNAQTPLPAIPAYLELMLALVGASANYPSFERDSVHPIMGKLAIGLIKLLERALAEPLMDWVAMLSILTSTASLLVHSPAPFRPLAQSLRTQLLPLILAPPSPMPVPEGVRQAALNLLTSLYVTAGKAQASGAWAADVRLALNGARASMDGVRRDGWDVNASSGSIAEGDIVDPAARLPVALDALQGWVDIVIAYVRKPTQRPVPIPIGPIVSLAMRCLDLGIDSPVVEYITPQHHAALIAALPRIWGMGMMLVGHLASTCGDHLLPHLSEIVDSTTYLSESVPRSMIQTHVHLLRLHRLLLNVYPPSVLPAETATRLLKDCISKLSIILDIQKSPASSAAGQSAQDHQGQQGGGGGNKKGKKRARGGEEDGLVGAFEGRGGKKVGDEWVVVVEALKLTPFLHQHPLVAPSLLTLSVRLHLSLHLLLPELPRDTFAPASASNQVYSQSSNQPQRAITAAVRDALEAAATSHGERGGWRMGWSNIILGVLSPSPSTAGLLHPSVPPLLRPAPPLSALHFFTTETAEEKKIRRELGLKIRSGRIHRGASGEGDGDESGEESDEDSDGEMEVDAESFKADGPIVNRPKLGGDARSHSRKPATTVTSANAGATEAVDVTVVVPVAPQDIRSGKASLDIGTPASGPKLGTAAEEVVLLAEPSSSSHAGTAKVVDPKEQEEPQAEGEDGGMDIDVDEPVAGSGSGFIRAPQAVKGKSAELAAVAAVSAPALDEEEEEDEAIPELDSGMSDFDDDEDEDEEDEVVE